MVVREVESFGSGALKAPPLGTRVGKIRISEAGMKALREIRATLADLGDGLQGFADSMPVTAVTLLIWVALLPVTVVRELLRVFAGLMKTRKLLARWLSS